jgi:hypothetical protein
LRDPNQGAIPLDRIDRSAQLDLQGEETEIRVQPF